MIEIEEITDVEGLKNTVFHLDKTVKSLLTQNAKLQREILELKGLNPQQIELALEVDMTRAGEPVADPEDGESDTILEPETPPAAQPKRARGRTPQLKLPRAEVKVPLEAGVCPDCGKTIEPFDSWDTSETITITRTVYTLIEEALQKGRCGCPDRVHTAPSTVYKMRSGGRYSVELTAHVVVNKWCDHLPLERQSRQMARLGLDVSPQALFDQSSAMADELLPNYNQQIAELLAGPVLGIDETTWKLLARGGSEYRAAIGLTTSTASGYLFREGKGTDVMEAILEPFSGTLVCDGLAVYSALAGRRNVDQSRAITIANCWAHAFRRFRDAASDFPRAQQMLTLIKKLYDIDKRAGPFPGDEMTSRRRAKLRAKESTLVLRRIRELALKLLELPKDLTIQKAATYLLNHWDGLTVFVRNPDVSLDNNACERDLRQLVQGRKNHYGSGSDRGLQTSAVLYTLVQTCLKLGVDPELYLSEAIRRRRANPSEIYLPRHAAAEATDR